MDSLNQIILKLAEENGACASALRMIPRLSVNSLLYLYKENLDYTLDDEKGRRFLTPDLMLKSASIEQLNLYGIYINQRIAVTAKLSDLVFMGNCEFNILHQGYKTANIYILDKCLGTLDTTDQSFAYVSLRDKASLSVIAKDKSRCSIFRTNEDAALITVETDHSRIEIIESWKNQH